MSAAFFDHPILNSLCEGPARHRESAPCGQPTQQGMVGFVLANGPDNRVCSNQSGEDDIRPACMDVARPGQLS